MIMFNLKVANPYQGVSQTRTSGDLEILRRYQLSGEVTVASKVQEAYWLAFLVEVGARVVPGVGVFCSKIAYATIAGHH